MLKLRALEPEDLEQLYAIENDLDDWEYSSMNAPFSRYALRDYIANQHCDLTIDQQVRLVVCDDEDEQQVIGLADIFNFDARHRRAEIGLVIAKYFRGHGYAAKATLLLIDYASKTCLLDQLYAFISADNKSCCKVFDNIGFKRASILENWFINANSTSDSIIFQLFLKKD